MKAAAGGPYDFPSLSLAADESATRGLHHGPRQKSASGPEKEELPGTEFYKDPKGARRRHRARTSPTAAPPRAKPQAFYHESGSAGTEPSMYDAANIEAAPIMASRPLLSSIWRLFALVSSSRPPIRPTGSHRRRPKGPGIEPSLPPFM